MPRLETASALRWQSRSGKPSGLQHARVSVDHGTASQEHPKAGSDGADVRIHWLLGLMQKHTLFHLLVLSLAYFPTNADACTCRWESLDSVYKRSVQVFVAEV